jgi:hypothetical protein
MFTFISFKNFGLIYSRVGAGAGAASKFFPGAGAATGSVLLIRAIFSGSCFPNRPHLIPDFGFCMSQETFRL